MRTLTECVPVLLICPGSSIRRRSTSGPPAAFAGLGPQRDLERFQLALDLLGMPEIAHLADLPGPLDLGDLLLPAAAPRNGVTIGNEVIAAVAVLHLDDIAGRADAGNFLGEDELHNVVLFLSARCSCRAAAPFPGCS